MYADYYLKFDSEADATAVLYDGETARYVNIDVLGVLYERNDDPEAEPVPLQGWHVNVRVVPGEESAILDPYAVHPTLPRRVWA
jgi:hypothetical protein